MMFYFYSLTKTKHLLLWNILHTVKSEMDGVKIMALGA
jgi:hypothetical protein